MQLAFATKIDWIGPTSVVEVKTGKLRPEHVYQAIAEAKLANVPKAYVLSLGLEEGVGTYKAYSFDVSDDEYLAKWTQFISGAYQYAVSKKKWKPATDLDLHDSSKVIFNEDPHTYTVDGIQIPGVTTMLQWASLKKRFVPSDSFTQEDMDRYAAFGKAVHKWIEWFEKKRREPHLKTIPYPYNEYIRAWIRFTEHHEFVPVEAERLAAATAYFDNPVI